MLLQGYHGIAMVFKQINTKWGKIEKCTLDYKLDLEGKGEGLEGRGREGRGRERGGDERGGDETGGE